MIGKLQKNIFRILSSPKRSTISQKTKEIFRRARLSNFKLPAQSSRRAS
jgi:hypothetical protein